MRRTVRLGPLLGIFPTCVFDLVSCLVKPLVSLSSSISTKVRVPFPCITEPSKLPSRLVFLRQRSPPSFYRDTSGQPRRATTGKSHGNSVGLAVSPAVPTTKVAIQVAVGGALTICSVVELSRISHPLPGSSSVNSQRIVL